MDDVTRTRLAPYRELPSADLEEDDGSKAQRAGTQLAAGVRYVIAKIGVGLRLATIATATAALILAASTLKALRIPHHQLDEALKRVYGKGERRQ